MSAPKLTVPLNWQEELVRLRASSSADAEGANQAFTMLQASMEDLQEEMTGKEEELEQRAAG